MPNNTNTLVLLLCLRVRYLDTCWIDIGHLDTCWIGIRHFLVQQKCYTCIEHLLSRLKGCIFDSIIIFFIVKYIKLSFLSI